jgi:predicted ATPase/DNA-binding SARP family transcriptional activator
MVHRQAPQPRQRLAFCFWSESTDAQARTNLRRELHSLRQALPDADRFIQADAKTIQWRSDAPFILDVAEFEQAAIVDQPDQSGQPSHTDAQTTLERAANLYRGDLLPDCYDDWIIPERERLQQICIRVLDQLIHLLQDQKNYRAAIRYAQQLLRLEPLNEATYRTLMQLHALNGDRAGALRLYQQCVESLKQELGVEPDAATYKLYHQLLSLHANQDDPLAQPVTSGFPVSARPDPLVAPAVLRQPGRGDRLSLIGREAEWAAIQRWVAARSNSAAAEILLVIGEPGIGKTRLLEELEAEVRQVGGRVLWGRGFEAEMLRPYGAWIDALRSIELSAIGNLPADLGTLLPEVNTVPDGSIDRSRLFDAVAYLLMQLSGDGVPTLVIVDDIQWLDEASTALLHYVIRLLSHAPLLVACASRQQELTHNDSVLKFVQALRREQRLRSIELVPLNKSQITELAHAVDATIDGDRVFADSGGNPLYALEVTRALAHPDTAYSDNLDALIQGRLQQLDGATRDLLPWAAALGRRFNPTTLGQIADYPLTKLLTALENLEQQGIIRSGAAIHGEMGYDFAHDRVRQVAYESLSEPRRRLIHLHIAQVLDRLAKTQATPDDRLSSDVVHHASLGGDRGLASAAALSAAERCLQLFAYAEAAELAQRGIEQCQSLDEHSRVRLHLGLLKVYVLAGVTRDRVAALEQELHQLIAEASALGFRDEEAIGLEALIALHHDHGNLADVQLHSLRAAEQGRAASPTTTARMLAYTGWCLAEIERDMHRAEALLLEAQSLADRVGWETIDISSGMGIVHYYNGNVAEARLLLGKAWRMAQANHDHWRECICLKYLAMLELEANNPMAVLDYSRTIAMVATKMGSEGSEGPLAAALYALVSYVQNQAEADTVLEQALDALRQIDNQRMLAYTQTAAADLDLTRGRIKQGLARSQDALKAAQIVDYPSGVALAWATLGQALWELGDRQGAARHAHDLHHYLGNRPLSARARHAVQRFNDRFNERFNNQFNHRLSDQLSDQLSDRPSDR